MFDTHVTHHQRQRVWLNEMSNIMMGWFLCVCRNRSSVQSIDAYSIPKWIERRRRRKTGTFYWFVSIRCKSINRKHSLIRLKLNVYLFTKCLRWVMATLKCVQPWKRIGCRANKCLQVLNEIVDVCVCVCVNEQHRRNGNETTAKKSRMIAHQSDAVNKQLIAN